MTYFDIDNIPDSFEMISPLPDDMVSEGVRLLRSARESGLLMAQEVKIAHLYDRKGYAEMDTFAGPRNASYGSDNDDVVIQVTVRIQNPQMFSGLQSLKNIIQERNNEAARKQLESEINALKIKKDAAEKSLQKKVDELSKLNVQS
jgi:hypothetical protein